MLSNIGLYYPFIEFQDDAWVKLAALYWDKLGRIALHNYRVRNSDTVQRLAGELDFIEDFEPSDEEKNDISLKFVRLLKQHKHKLRGRYGVYRAGKYSGLKDPFSARLDYFQSWPSVEDLWRLWHDEEECSRPVPPALIFSSGRMTDELRHELWEAGLALTLRSSDGDKSSITDNHLLALHPKLAYIYLEALAEEMAAARHFYPVTDSMLDHLAINGCTLERLAQALLNELSENGEDKGIFLSRTGPSKHEIEVKMATIALQFVLPHDLENVPTEKIVKFRKQHSNELAAFQAYLQEFVKNLDELGDIKDLAAIQAHLEVAYQKELKPQLDDLKKCLRSLGMETVTGVMNIRVALPTLVVSGGAYLGQAHLGPINPILAGAGALAFSVLPVIRDKAKEARDKARSSPAAYLLYMQEDLEPAKLSSRITQMARKVFFQV